MVHEMGNGTILMNITIPTSDIREFCEYHHIKRFALFGSVLGESFRADSDIDVLVEFEAGNTPGFFRLVEMQDELSLLLGRTVDLNNPLSLSPHFRNKVAANARVIYERT